MKSNFLILIIILCSFNSFAQGLIFELYEFSKTERIKPSRSEVTPLNYSIKQYAPQILSQNKSECLAYSIATARTMLLAKNLGIVDRDSITSFFFSPHWIYYRNKDKDDNDCYSGLSFSKSIMDIKANGIPFMYDIEYDKYYPWSQKELCNEFEGDYEKCINKAQQFKLDAIKSVTNLKEIKLSLSRGFPVVLGIRVFNSFEKAFNKEIWDGEVVENEITYGHALVVVSYDDNRDGGSIELLNSWGENWGQDGFIWVKYSDIDKIILGGYSLVNSIKFQKKNLQSKNNTESKVSAKNETITKFLRIKNLVKQIHQ